ncbi:hypothetical protein [Scytonema sp. HK-05]|nr:hypothetical protein [Scytonema sp. HK-05]
MPLPRIAIADWLSCRTNLKPSDPLFIALDFHTNDGHQRRRRHLCYCA